MTGFLAGLTVARMMTTKKDKLKDQLVTVHVNFPAEVIRAIDEKAVAESRTRVNMIQVLVKQGLDTNASA